MAAERRTRRVGFLISKSKQANLAWLTLTKRGHEEFGLVFVELNVDADLESQGHFDVLLLKWNQQLAKILAPNPDARNLERVNRVRKFIRDHPNVRVVDTLEAQTMIMKRDDVVHIFRELDRRIPNVHCPTSLTLAVDAEKTVVDSIKFPVIVKAIEGGGTEESHQMGIVFNKRGIDAFRRPVLVQEFLNHDATIEKVFVIDDFVHAVRRPSLPNFEASEEREPLMFNSQAFGDILGSPQHYDVPLPSIEILHSISKALTEITGLTLFGYDLIRDAETGKYSVIDINFFPGFEGVPDFETHFLRLLAK